MSRKLPALLLLASACATVRPERGHNQVDELVDTRLGVETGWGAGDPGAEAISERVDELLGAGLTRERAIRIALLNNPELRATYAGLGVSQADMVQAGLLSNPVLAGSVGFPIGNGGRDRLEYEASLVHSLLEVFVLPLRKRVAKEQFTVDLLRVADRAVEVATQASHALVRYQAADRALELQRVLLHVAKAAAAEAEARYHAGNTTRLERDTERAAYEEERRAFAIAELERIEAREELNRVLGLWGAQTEWTLAEPLREALAEDPDLEDLESLALRQRLDVDAARRQVFLMHNAVRVARTSRFTGPVEVGVHIHQDPHGPRLLGPTLALELPIFDRRQAMIARLEAQRDEAQHRLDALAIATRATVRATAAKLRGLRQQLEHQLEVLLPLRERIVEGTQRQYNAMQIGLAPLLQVRKKQAEEYKRYLETLRDYWIVRAELERLVGGSLRPLPSPQEAEP